MRVYITRHGTTEWNIEKRLQGWKNSNLTEDGIYRAVKLGERLDDVEFDAIYTSPLKRAMDTAKHIRGEKDTPIVAHEGLKELGGGVWDGMLASDIEEKYPKEYYYYHNDPDKYIPIGGETYKELFNRIDAFLDDIKKTDDKNILVVSHGVTIKGIISKIKNLNINAYSRLPIYTGTALSIIEFNGDSAKFILENDASHIEDDLQDEISI